MVTFYGAVSCESTIIDAYYSPQWGLGDMPTLPVCEFSVIPDENADFAWICSRNAETAAYLALGDIRWHSEVVSFVGVCINGKVSINNEVKRGCSKWVFSICEKSCGD